MDLGEVEHGVIVALELNNIIAALCAKGDTLCNANRLSWDI